MQKSKLNGAALLTAVLLFFAFVLTSCGGSGSKELGALRDIYIVTSGLKTNYDVGDTFDYSAVQIRAVYEQGDEKLTAASEGVTHNELDLTKPGTQTLTVTYKEKSASVAITVREKENAVLKGLQFSGGKTAYTVGDTIDYSQFKLTAIYSVGDDLALSGDSEGVTHNTVSTAQAGTQKLTFTYQEGDVSKSVSVDIVVSEAPASVVLISIEVRSAAADRSVAFGGTVDYSKFTIVRHFSDGSSDSELNGTSEGVSHNDIDATIPGEQELVFTYEGKSSAPVTITVLAEKVTLHRFALPAFYTEATAIEDDEAGTKSEDRDSFMKGGKTYKVGDDNAFEFQPDGRVLMLPSMQEISVTVITTFTLAIKDAEGENFTPVAEAEAGQYVTTNPLLPNLYYFTEQAVGKVFKLTITPDAANYTVEGNGSIEAVLEVVDGYNVYNQIGLSVFDNVNVKHWHDVKEAAGTLRWDSKPLVDYNIIKTGDEKFAPVKSVVLHGNITIDPDELPDNFFWQATDEGYTTVDTFLKNNAQIPDAVKNHLEGSLKDGINKDQYYQFDDETSGDLKEDEDSTVNMQKGVYTSTGTSVIGNFHTITYHTTGIRHSLYTVYDGKDENGSAFPLSHWSLFKYSKTSVKNVEIVNEGLPTVSDLRILGQSPRKPATDGEPAHLMAFNSCTNKVTLENCIVTRLFVVLMGDTDSAVETTANADVSDCKLFDIYSNMFYLWRAQVNVTNSIMKDAGGPIFILCDGDRSEFNSDKYPLDKDAEGPNLVVDEGSALESLAAGNESWYALNGVSAMFGQIKGGAGNGLADAARGYLGREAIVKQDGIDFVNVVAVIIPEPASLATPKANYTDSLTTSGQAIIGDETFKMHPKMPGWGSYFMASMAEPSLYASQAPYFVSEGLVAIYGGAAMQAMAGYGFGDVIASSTGTNAGDWAFTAAGVRAAWEKVTSPYLFMTMRAAATVTVGSSGFPSVTNVTPRIGILVGSVTKAGS